MSTSLDEIYDTILVEHHKGNPSVTELAEKIGRSRASVFARLKVLEDEGLLAPPPQAGQARSRSLTELGKSYLKANGLVQTQVFDNERWR